MLINIRRSPYGNDFVLEVQTYYTGSTILKKIEYMCKINLDNYTLLHHENVTFEAHITVSDYGIEEGDSLLLNLKDLSAESFKIYIQLNGIGGGPLRLNVLPSYNIRTIKVLIFGMTGIEVDSLLVSFRGLQLENTRTLSNYNIKMGSTLLGSRKQPEF